MILTILGSVVTGVAIGSYLNKKKENEELQKKIKELEDEKNSRSSEDILWERNKETQSTDE